MTATVLSRMVEAGPTARIFSSQDAPAEPAGIEVLERAVQDADLLAPPVVLPDFHHKANMEMPSSIAVATRDSIRPTLTSASVNCGMALVALNMDRPGAGAITDFYRRITQRYPYPRTLRRELSASDVLECALQGGAFAVHHFAAHGADLDRVEEAGRLALEPYGGEGRARRELSWLLLQLSRLRFGSIGPSNHFVELQEVAEIYDPRAATLLGVHPGQVTLQYHAGGGVLTGLLGALFGNRRHSTRALRTVMRVAKPLSHLRTAESVAQLHERRRLYFGDGCPPVERQSGEGQRLLLANALAMNYGFAFRLATYAALRRFAVEAFGVDGRLIVDSPHNSIYEEDVDGEPAVVHRHNACRAYPASRMAGHPAFSQTGQAVLLPGTHRTSSYLCVAAEGAARSLYSACHGAGTTIADFARRGLSGLDPKRRVTVRYRYGGGDIEAVPQLDDRGVDEALAILVHHGLVRPIARLRPFAVLT